MDPTDFLCKRKHGGTIIVWKSNIKYKVTPNTAVSFYQRSLLSVNPGTLFIFFITGDLNTSFSRNTPQTCELSIL